MLAKLKQNWKAGLTVALASIPLSISLAVAANATPLMGIITAVWAGLIASFFGGSNYNIVGPTGALSGILASYVLLHGVETLPILAIVSGLIILLVYVFHLAKYIIYVPASVVHGFTLGVALLIAFNQLNFATGLSGLPVHESFIMNLWESLKHLGNIDPATFIVFLLGLIFLFVFGKMVQRFPGPIVLAPLGILLGYLSQKGFIGFELQTLASRFGDISVDLVSIPAFSVGVFSRDLIVTAITIAIIGILESLISGKIADGMTKTKFNRNKEVLGLGLANVASGFMGGIPATAALARTALNVKSGATHKTSAGISSVVIAVIALVFLPQFKFLTLNIVASILVFVAIKMIKHEHFVHLFRHDKKAFFLSILVAVITIVEDPIVGILLGAVVALLLFVNELSKGQAEVTINKNKDEMYYVDKEHYGELMDHGEVLVYRFAGILTYVNSLSHIENVERIKGPHTVILSFRHLFYIDLDGLDALEEIVEILEEKKIKIMLTGLSVSTLSLVRNKPFYKKLQKKGMIFSRTADALKRLKLVA